MNPHLMNALANSLAFWIALILGLLTLYILSSLIGAIRGVEGRGWIVVIGLGPSLRSIRRMPAWQIEGSPRCRRVIPPRPAGAWQKPGRPVRAVPGHSDSHEHGLR